MRLLALPVVTFHTVEVISSEDLNLVEHTLSSCTPLLLIIWVLHVIDSISLK